MFIVSLVLPNGRKFHKVEFILTILILTFELLVRKKILLLRTRKCQIEIQLCQFCYKI